MESADPVLQAESRLSTIPLKQLISMARKMTDDDITLPLYVAFIQWREQLSVQRDLGNDR